MEPIRNLSGQVARLESARLGLRKLVKHGRVAPVAVLACPELTQLAPSIGGAADDSVAAPAGAAAGLQAVERLPDRAVLRALLGIDPQTEGDSLRNRRRAAAELADVRTESFRVRTESRFLDELAHALLIELAASQPVDPSSTLRVALVYSQADATHAAAINDRLTREPDIAVTLDVVDDAGLSRRGTFVDSVRDNDAVVHLISVASLKSLSCMRDLLSIMQSGVERSEYRQRTIPILIEDEDDHIDLFAVTDQLQLVDHWMHAKKQLEEQIESRGEEYATALEAVRTDLVVIRDITERLMRFLRTVTDSSNAMRFSTQAGSEFADVVTTLRAIRTESARDAEGAWGVSSPRRIKGITSSRPDLDPVRASTSLSHRRDAKSPEVRRLTELYDSIRVASENDPDQPEFPPFSPRFPATPAYPIEVPQLGREILVKDESYNFTGSHKDRMAWEVVVYYKMIIQDLMEPHAKSVAIPAASIISSGSAALAIQVMLRCFDLPSLRVLVDQRTDRRILRKLRRVGCDIYMCDLHKKELDSAAVLQLTENETGFDLTARSLIDPNRRTYYDWLAYEILNCGAKHVFIPVGTGDLYVNVLTVLRDELLGIADDRRLMGGSSALEGLEIYGATSSDRKTKMDRLYAPYRPTLEEARRVVAEMRDQGLCGTRSGIYDVRERVIKDALAIARASNIRCDESGIAGLSLLLQMSEEGIVPTDESVLVVNTGLLEL